MKRPNFFIIGAPKSGTSALAFYLREHPNIFISKDKELNYWNDDFRNVSLAATLDEYLAHFKSASDNHLAVGEATVHYLFSPSAVPRIRAFNPEAKLVALLRNPVDLAYSWHSQMLYGLYEDEPDFETAWALQERRARGERIPKHCVEPKVLQYRALASMGEQVERLYRVYPREQTRIYLFDDFKASNRTVYADVLEFLGIPDDGRTEFPVINENKTHRHAALATLTERPPKFWVNTARIVKKALGIERIGLLKKLKEMNREPVKREALPPAFRAQLTEAFRPDIERLAAALGRDLSAWLVR
ncbi:MAG: hypothetical protein QG656_602 [Candidatus Hydrogenedentes bacterium]|nr:hypothetical protein [Candidatus Hydrogenedentota bacterium]